MYNSGKHSLFLYTLTNFNAISHIAVILCCTNVLKIRQGSVILFARYMIVEIFEIDSEF
jgi:hypothetical protein